MHHTAINVEDKHNNHFKQKLNSSISNIKAKRRSFASLIGLAIQFSRPYRRYVWIILVAMLVETLVGLATPWPLKIIIDNVVDKQPLPDWLKWMNRFFHGENSIELAAIVALSYIALIAIDSLAKFLDSYYNEKVAQYVANDLRVKIYHHLLHLSLSYYHSHLTGNLLNTLTKDVSTLQDFASNTMLSILVDCLTIIGMIGVMFYLDSDFTLIALAITPFLLFFVFHFKKGMKKATREVRKDEGNMLVVLQKGLQSMRAVNAFGRQDFEEDKLKVVSQETVDAAMKARRIKAALSPVVAIIVSTCTAIVLWRGAYLVNHSVMTVGALTVFISYMAKFFSPVKDLAKMTSSIAQVTVALERIQAILQDHTSVSEKPGAIEPEKLQGNITFENISFSYNPEAPLIKDFNLDIRCGQRIGICGHTGCGKSTIVSLLARFYDPDAGRILIDGKDISEFTLDGLRKQFGFVMQETMLFYGSVRENIAYGRPDATEEEIVEAARLANALEFIEKMPHGFDTFVGERGATLSGGQLQRIGIARAVVRNSPILILDEPTSSLDSEAEKVVMAALENLMEGRTIITIAHRLNTIRNVDKIIVLSDGRIAEEGSHEELMKKGGIYSELYKTQQWTEASS
jgi:ABC-type multidrug transport system fused ATPase/permease subunit